MFKALTKLFKLSKSSKFLKWSKFKPCQIMILEYSIWYELLQFIRFSTKMKLVSTVRIYNSLCKSGYSRMVMTLLNIKSPFVLENGHSVKKKISVKKLMLSLVQTETRYVNWFISVLCSQKITDFWEEYKNMKERHIF